MWFNHDLSILVSQKSESSLRKQRKVGEVGISDLQIKITWFFLAHHRTQQEILWHVEFQLNEVSRAPIKKGDFRYACEKKHLLSKLKTHTEVVNFISWPLPPLH